MKIDEKILIKSRECVREHLDQVPTKGLENFLEKLIYIGPYIKGDKGPAMPMSDAFCCFEDYEQQYIMSICLLFTLEEIHLRRKNDERETSNRITKL